MRYSYKLGRSIRILVGISVAAISFGLTTPPARAENVKTATSAAPRAATKPSKKMQRPAAQAETIPSSGNRYFVEFRGRAAASYGHMYVLYGQVNERGEIIKSEIAGLHPAGDANNCENCSLFPWMIGHVIFVPAETGASDGDLEEKYVTSRYRVMLDEAHYRRVAAYIKKLQAENPLWNALWRNCVSFGRDIAQYMGLRTPAFIWLEPKDFVDDLRELNGGSQQQPLGEAPSSAEGAGSVSSQPHSTSSRASSARQKPKKRPANILPHSRTAGMASGTPR